MRPTRREDLRCGRGSIRLRWGTFNHEYTSENFAKAQVKVEEIWSMGLYVGAIDGRFG